MKNFNFDRNNAYQDFEKLPKGAYILKILNVKYTEGEGDKSDMLRLQVDIVEGEYKDFFKKQFEADTREDKKWRGVFDIWCPRNDGSEKDGWTKRTFDTCFAAIEDSNPGFRFNGTDENTLKGKVVGAIYYRKDYVKDGVNKEGYSFYKNLIDADKVRKGTWKAPKDYILAAEESNKVDGDGFMSIPTGSDDEELPF